MKTSALIASSLFILALPARDIVTDEWGIFWECPKEGLKEVDETATPGSDSFCQPRIRRPAMYAFLDGFDTRHWAMTNRIEYDAEPSPSTNFPFYLRHKFSTAFDKRRRDLLEFKVGKELESETYYPQSGTLWGSTALDGYVESQGYPIADTFLWEENPGGRIYSTKGTGWMPTLVTLKEEGSQFWVPWPASVYAARCSDGGGIAVQEGWKRVVFDKPHAFRSFVNTYRKVKLPTFETVLSNEFASAHWKNVVSELSVGTRRLRYGTLATASQALNCFDKTYFIPKEMDAITNLQNGTCRDWYAYAGTVLKPIHFDLSDPYYPEFGFDDGSDESGVVGWVKTGDGQSKSANNYRCWIASPCGGVSELGQEFGATGYVEGYGHTATTSVTYEDIESMVDELFLRIGEPLHDFWLNIQASILTPKIELCATHAESFENMYKEIGIAMPSNASNVTLRASASMEFSYGYVDASSIVSGYVKDPLFVSKWKYPLNGFYLTDDYTGYPLRFNFFHSFAASEDYDDASGWTPLDDRSRNPNDYDYAFSQIHGVRAGDFIDNLLDELSKNLSKYNYESGAPAANTPRQFLGISSNEIANVLSSVRCTGANLVAEPVESGPGWDKVRKCFRVHITGGTSGYVMDPPRIDIATVRIEPTFYVDSGAYVSRPNMPKSCETRIRAITEAWWKFPQLQRKEEE